MNNRNIIIILMFALLASCTSFSQPETLTPTSTYTPTQTATLTSTATITPTPTITPTATPVPLSLVFEEDFESDPLGWKLIQFNPPKPLLKFSYNNDGLDFWFRTKDYSQERKRGINVIALDGDFDLEVVFDRRVHLSGLWFSNSSLTQRSSDNWFYVLIEQGGSLDNWKNEKAHLGTYQPSSQYWGYFEEGSHTLTGEFDDFIAKQNGEIHLRLSFRGNRLNASVNGSPIITDTNQLYSGKKYFMGFVIGAMDQFIVKALRVWIANKENFEIVNAADVVWKEAAPTFDAILSMTPVTQTNTPTSVALTPSSPPTIDSFVGVWRTIHPRAGGWGRIEITEDGNTLSARFFGECGPSNELLCAAIIGSTTFEGSPIIMHIDSGFVVSKMTLQREGNLLHVTTFSHYTDTSRRHDTIDEGYFHR